MSRGPGRGPPSRVGRGFPLSLEGHLGVPWFGDFYVSGGAGGPGREPLCCPSALVALPADTGVMPSLWEKKSGLLVGGFSASCGGHPIPADLHWCDLSGPPGNAAIVLRSRLKVKVVKELRGKKLAVPNGTSKNGAPAADLDPEVGKQVMQYQVRGQAPQRVPKPCPVSWPRGGSQGGRVWVDPSGKVPILRAFQRARGSPAAGRAGTAPQCAVASLPPGLKRGGD